MNIIDRIKDFLEDRPVESEATGMFIERDDLKELLGIVEFGSVKNVTFNITEQQATFKSTRQTTPREHATFISRIEGPLQPLYSETGVEIIYQGKRKWFADRDSLIGWIASRSDLMCLPSYEA